MAKSVDKRGRADGEVSDCVSGLINAFTNSLDIFKRIRERRRKRRSKRHKGHSEQASGAELQLSNSLRRGPLDIQESYEKNYGKAGDRFAKGDGKFHGSSSTSFSGTSLIKIYTAIAHASLAETLLKLNTGLVGIIASFLNHDSKSNHLNLDYKSLTNLSDASRAEAIQSLNQLCQRLSQSQLQIYRIGACPRCGSSKHQNCSGGVASEKSGPAKEHQAKKTHSSSRTRSRGPTIARIPIKSSSNTQLAVVRPRNTRKSSTSSSSSSRSNSTAANSPYASPLGSPLPQYSPMDPFPPQKPAKKASPPPGRRRGNSIDGPRPTTWPYAQASNTVPPIPPKLPPIPPKIPIARKSPPPREKHTPSPGTGPVVKRRMDKATPSTFTFASDSTKLGEIPQRNWTTPWDYEEAERLNAEAVVNGYPTPVVERPKAKKGLFSFLRRGSAAN